MNYFAFIPRDNGTAPMGTAGSVILREYKTQGGAIRAAKRRLGNELVAVFSYTNFYDNGTFKQVFNSTGKQVTL